MFYHSFQKLIFITLLAAFVTAAQAQVGVSAPNNVYIPNSPGSNISNLGTAPTTNATAFAAQAGSIAGAAQACGQDTTNFLTRVNEALDRLSLSSTDKVLAMARLQQAMQTAQAEENTKHPFLCAQVLQDFSGLPLLRDDYRQTVLNQLSPTMGVAPVPPTAIPQGNPPGNIPTGPSPGALVGRLPPNVDTITPGGTPPPPDFPNSADANNAPNIIYQAPSVAPRVDTLRPAPNINDIAPNPYQDLNPPAVNTNPNVGQFPAQTVPPPAVNP